MNELRVTLDGGNPPLPARPKPGGRARVAYRFDEIPVGGSARFNRSFSQISKKVTAWHKTHPGQRYVVRAITPTHSVTLMCRVWRVQ